MSSDFLTVCLVGEWDEPGRSEPVHVLFGWRMGGLGWLQDGIFLSDAGWTRPSKSGGRSRSSRVGSHQTLNFFNQTLNGAALSLILQPNTKMGWLHLQKQKCNQTLNGLTLSQKLGWIQPNPQPNTVNVAAKHGKCCCLDVRIIGFGIGPEVNK